MNAQAKTWSNLSGFKRDVLIAVLRRGGSPGSEPDDRPYGLAIKREVEIIRDTEVNHGRLYPNLDDLVDAGLLRKGERDRRTNTYHATEAGVDALTEYLREYAGLAVASETVAVAPRDEYDDQTSQERGDVVTDGGQTFPSGITVDAAEDEVVLMIPTSESDPAARRGIHLSRDEALELADDLCEAVDDTIPDNIEAMASIAETLRNADDVNLPDSIE